MSRTGRVEGGAPSPSFEPGPKKASKDLMTVRNHTNAYAGGRLAAIGNFVRNSRHPAMTKRLVVPHSVEHEADERTSKASDRTLMP